MEFPEGFEPKSASQQKPKDERKSGLPPLDELKGLLDKLGEVAGPAQRAKCLSMALKLDNLSAPEDAVNAAKMFEAYILGKEAK